MSLDSRDYTQNYIQDLITAGNDAHSNLYELEFTGGVFNNNETSTSARVRTSGFTPPSINQESYTVRYITSYVDWPRAKVNVTRSFDIEFRVDSYWEIYKRLQEQKKIFLNASHSFAGTDISEEDNKFFIVKVNVLKDGMTSEDEDVTDKLYEFQHCWISKIDAPKFTQGTSDSIKVSITINFLEMYDKESGFPD